MPPGFSSQVIAVMIRVCLNGLPPAEKHSAYYAVRNILKARLALQNLTQTALIRLGGASLERNVFKSQS